MLALSTSWQSAESATAEEMLAALKNLEITGIELGYSISEDFYRSMKGPLKRSGLTVVSIHNFFPIPSIRAGAKGSGDLFLLSSTDPKERYHAVYYTAKTIDHAAELGAGAVVLHCGVVEMIPETQVLYQYFNQNRLDSNEAQRFIHHKLEKRDRFKGRHLDSLLSSLDPLVSVAEKRGVRLGLENRYHYHELPGLDDFSVIFDAFEGAPIGYWHDTGHAHANEALGLIPQNALLRRYADRLIGVHLHDAVGLDDHIPPGAGEVDFTSLKPFLKSEIPRVMEIKPGLPASAVTEGVRFVREELAGA